MEGTVPLGLARPTKDIGALLESAPAGPRRFQTDRFGPGMSIVQIHRWIVCAATLPHHFELDISSDVSVTHPGCE